MFMAGQNEFDLIRLFEAHHEIGVFLATGTPNMYSIPSSCRHLTSKSDAFTLFPCSELLAPGRLRFAALARLARLATDRAVLGTGRRQVLFQTPCGRGAGALTDSPNARGFFPVIKA